MPGEVMPARLFVACVVAMETLHAGEVRGGVVEARGSSGEVNRYEPVTHMAVHSDVVNEVSRVRERLPSGSWKKQSAIRSGVSSLENLARKQREPGSARAHNLNPDGGS